MGDAPATATVLPHRTVNHHVDSTYAAKAAATGSEYSRARASSTPRAPSASTAAPCAPPTSLPRPASSRARAPSTPRAPSTSTAAPCAPPTSPPRPASSRARAPSTPRQQVVAHERHRRLAHQQLVRQRHARHRPRHLVGQQYLWLVTARLSEGEAPDASLDDLFSGDALDGLGADAGGPADADLPAGAQGEGASRSDGLEPMDEREDAVSQAGAPPAGVLRTPTRSAGESPASLHAPAPKRHASAGATTGPATPFGTGVAHLLPVWTCGRSCPLWAAAPRAPTWVAPAVLAPLPGGRPGRP